MKNKCKDLLCSNCVVTIEYLKISTIQSFNNINSQCVFT
jgi:hypothetical protein